MAVVSDLVVVMLLLTNLRLLASSRIAACIQTVAQQAVILSIITLTSSLRSLTLSLLLVALSTAGVKGLLLPWLLRRAARGVGVSREVEPFVGFTTSVLIGGGLMGASFMIGAPLHISAAFGLSPMLIPGAMFTILTGLFIVVSRRKALTQVIGYLALENGVYAFGSSLAVEEPLLVEMGILLDVVVAIFIMGIVIFQINREFDHIDTDKLSALKD